MKTWLKYENLDNLEDMMNKKDRAQVAALHKRYDAAADVFLLARIDVVAELRAIADEQLDRFDNQPEALQNGEIGQGIQEAAETLGDFADELEGTDFDFEVDWPFDTPQKPGPPKQAQTPPVEVKPEAPVS